MDSIITKSMTGALCPMTIRVRFAIAGFQILTYAS
jgi:hypothetical protein